MSDRDFMDDALCAQTDPEAFFLEKGKSTRQAKMVCGRCAVVAECRMYALVNGEDIGIWGGMSPRELRAERVRLGIPSVSQQRINRGRELLAAGLSVEQVAERMSADERTVENWASEQGAA